MPPLLPRDGLGLDLTAPAPGELARRLEAAGVALNDGARELLAHPALTAPPRGARAVHLVERSLAELGLHLPLMAGLETAAGVWNAREIMIPPVAWAYFGAEDYTTDLGGTRTPGNLEVLYARSRVALAARLAGVAALDIVVTRLNDEAAFREDALQGRALGYSGKLCIHPAQVALAHDCFGPTPADLSRARALLDAAHRAAQAGHGAFSFEGQMVDEPMLAKARALLASAEKDNT